MAHNINKNTYDAYKQNEMHKELLDLKKEGKVYGYSNYSFVAKLIFDFFLSFI